VTIEGDASGLLQSMEELVSRWNVVLDKNFRHLSPA